MSIGQREKATQKRVIKLFVQELGYTYLGDFTERKNANIETELLTKFLTRKGYSPVLINRALKELQDAAGDQSVNLYDLNEQTYKKLRYGVKVSESVGQHKITVQFVDWENPLENDFYIAEEVTIKHKRPDLVLYINGIAFAVIELKRSTVSMSEGIRQNLTNQRPDMIMQFFATVGLVLAGNDSEGARYGTTGTPEKYYLSWKEDSNAKDEVSAAVRAQIGKYPLRLDKNLISLCRKERLVELLHNFIVFDSGVKKTCRPNQFFGNMAARDFIRRHEGGIIWHTQGSGKSLTMVWLSKWIKENISDSRILIITDRDELDVQIEQVFAGVNESIVRIRRGSELIQKINDYIKVRDDVRLASGDYVDLKKYDPDMRHLIDTYLSADPSRVLTSFGGATLVELLVDNGISALKDMPASTPKEQEAVAETIENNIGKEIVERIQSNPKYYEKMSALLRELIEKRKNDVINYEEYLRQIVELARKVHKPESGTEYPSGIRESAAKRAFYDHLNGDTDVANQIYNAVMSSKQDNFRGSNIKERKIWRAIRAVVKDDQEADQLLALVKEQSEF